MNWIEFGEGGMQINVSSALATRFGFGLFLEYVFFDINLNKLAIIHLENIWFLRDNRPIKLDE